MMLTLLLFVGGLSATTYQEQSDLFYGSYDENYIIRWGFQSACDHAFDPRVNEFLWPSQPGGVAFDPAAVKPGDVIFVRDVGTYFKKIHPKIQHPYIMVTAGEYRDKVKPEFLSYLDDPLIIAWFSVHACKKSHPKFYQIPLGIFQNKKYYTPRAELTQLFAQWRHEPKKKLLYMNFGDIRGKKPERADVVEIFKNAPFCHEAERKPFLDYMKEMSEYKFSLSPRGYGPDAYRNYEAMLVGSIPIVHTSQLDPLYEDLPVLIVHDWHEVTEEFLEQKYTEMTTKKYNIEKLFMDYWWKKIDDVKTRFLKGYKQ